MRMLVAGFVVSVVAAFGIAAGALGAAWALVVPALLAVAAAASALLRR